MENEIVRETAALVAALRRGDPAAAGGVYTNGARLLTSSADLIEGRAEIEAFWRAGIELGLSGLAFERQVLEEIGVSVVELGRYAVSVRRAAPATVVERGAYLVLHAPAGNRSWRRAVEVFNADEPTARRENEKEER
jgi:ketosteroid isomerase-like protein